MVLHSTPCDSLYLFPPGRQNRLHLMGDLLPGQRAIQTSRQQRVVLGVLVTNRGGNGRGQREFGQCTQPTRPTRRKDHRRSFRRVNVPCLRKRDGLENL